MASKKSAGHSQPLSAKKKPKASKKASPAPAASPDVNSPGRRLRRFIEKTLRADPQITLPGLLEATNAWAKQGHTHKGYALWPEERPFGPHYLGLLLREAWAAKLVSSELHGQARFFRENPDKDLDDLARETRARLELARARDAERQARKREEARVVKAERERQAEADRERRERERDEERERAAAQARERHTRALAYVVEFFLAAGIDSASDGHAVRVAGAKVDITSTQASNRGKLDALIDALVWSRFRDKLLQSISRHLDGAAELRAITGTNGWVLSQDRTPLVVIHATSAKVRSMPARSGNFLAGDLADWTPIADEMNSLRSREVSRVIVPQSTRRLFTEVPNALPDELRGLALHASRQLRTERNLAFGHAVELQHRGGAIRFHPLRQGPTHVELPIIWSRWSEGSRAELRIGGRTDPLHLSFGGDDNDDAVVRGWLIALVGYAELVCRDDLMELRPPRQQLTGPAPTPGSPRPKFEHATGAGARFGAGLTPIGLTKRWIASYVAGHRRRLRPGHQASAEARVRAGRVGITLRPQETWVSPHVRGVPPDAVLQFQWDAPRELEATQESR